MLDVFMFDRRRVDETFYENTDDGEVPPPDIFEDSYQYAGHDADATRENIQERWSYGGGDISTAFAMRSCRGCVKTFCPTAGGVVLPRLRDLHAAMHEYETGHVVTPGKRPFAVGDIVGDDGEAYMLTGDGWVRAEKLDPAMRPAEEQPA